MWIEAPPPLSLQWVTNALRRCASYIWVSPTQSWVQVQVRPTSEPMLNQKNTWALSLSSSFRAFAQTVLCTAEWSCVFVRNSVFLTKVQIYLWIVIVEINSLRNSNFSSAEVALFYFSARLLWSGGSLRSEMLYGLSVWWSQRKGKFLVLSCV